MTTHRSLLLAGLTLALSSFASAEGPRKSAAPAPANPPLTIVSLRYIVSDVTSAIDFYARLLGFAVELDAAPNFAIVTRGNLRLLLSARGGTGGGARPMPDGRQPEPGGWNRFQLPVADLRTEVARLRAAGARFRNEIVRGNGGLQILLEDPSGNPIELWQAGP